jgi:hypothetical protein
MENASCLWVLTSVLDDSDPRWQTRQSIVGTREQLAKLFDLNRLPYGMRLLKGKAAARYIKLSLKYERRYQREQQLKRQAGGAS